MKIILINKVIDKGVGLDDGSVNSYINKLDLYLAK